MVLPWAVKLILFLYLHHELGEVQEDARIGMQILTKCHAQPSKTKGLRANTPPLAKQ